jgi:hypothetical protein
MTRNRRVFLRLPEVKKASRKGTRQTPPGSLSRRTPSCGTRGLPRSHHGLTPCRRRNAGRDSPSRPAKKIRAVARERVASPLPGSLLSPSPTCFFTPCLVGLNGCPSVPVFTCCDPLSPWGAGCRSGRDVNRSPHSGALSAALPEFWSQETFRKSGQRSRRGAYPRHCRCGLPIF